VVGQQHTKGCMRSKFLSNVFDLIMQPHLPKIWWVILIESEACAIDAEEYYWYIQLVPSIRAFSCNRKKLEHFDVAQWGMVDEQKHLE